MPFIIKNLRLDKMELLSIVDKGASGDDENRPRIELFKRKKPTVSGRISNLLKRAFTKEVKKMDLQAQLDALGLSPDQMDAILKLLEGLKGAPSDAPATDQATPAAKADGVPAAPAAVPDGPVVVPAVDPTQAPVVVVPATDANSAPTVIVPPEANVVEADTSAGSGGGAGAGKAGAGSPVAAQKRFAVSQAETIALQKRVKDLEAAAELVELEKRADELKFIPMARTELINMIKRVGSDKAGNEMLVRLNKAGKESPLLRVAGATVHGDQSATEVTIAKRVKALMDDDPKKSASIAKREVFKNDPELYQELLEAQRG